MFVKAVSGVARASCPRVPRPSWPRKFAGMARAGCPRDARAGRPRHVFMHGLSITISGRPGTPRFAGTTATQGRLTRQSCGTGTTGTTTASTAATTGFTTSRTSLRGQGRYVYDAYGKVSIFDGSWSSRQLSSYDNSILYCGYYRDAETGLESEGVRTRWASCLHPRRRCPLPEEAGRAGRNTRL